MPSTTTSSTPTPAKLILGVRSKSFLISRLRRPASSRMPSQVKQRLISMVNVPPVRRRTRGANQGTVLPSACGHEFAFVLDRHRVRPRAQRRVVSVPGIAAPGSRTGRPGLGRGRLRADDRPALPESVPQLPTRGAAALMRSWKTLPGNGISGSVHVGSGVSAVVHAVAKSGQETLRRARLAAELRKCFPCR